MGNCANVFLLKKITDIPKYLFYTLKYSFYLNKSYYIDSKT